MIEAALADLVRAAVAPLEAAQREFSAELRALRHALPPATCSVPEAARRLGVAEATVRRRIASGELRTIAIGRRRLVDMAALRGPTEDEVATLAAAARGAGGAGR